MKKKTLSSVLICFLFILFFVFVTSCSSTSKSTLDAKANYSVHPSKSSKNKKIHRNYTRKHDKHDKPLNKNYIIRSSKSGSTMW
ncbi:MAG: hypothetical protein KAT48_11000 [Bacteroidales bacterium]|nr:hypothetical protein [Bacteroidales bacterium]